MLQCGIAIPLCGCLFFFLFTQYLTFGSMIAIDCGAMQMGIVGKRCSMLPLYAGPPFSVASLS